MMMDHWWGVMDNRVESVDKTQVSYGELVKNFYSYCKGNDASNIATTANDVRRQIYIQLSFTDPRWQ